MLRRRGMSDSILNSWQRCVESRPNTIRTGFLELCEYHHNEHRRIDRSLQLLERVIYDQGARPGDELMTSFVDSLDGLRLGPAAEVIAILAQRNAHYWHEVVRPAFSFGQGADQIAAVLVALIHSEHDDIVSAADALAALRRQIPSCD